MTCALGELAGQTHRLSDSLGEDHDLYVLRGKVAGDARVMDDAAAGSALIALIDRRRGELQRQAPLLGRKLYEERLKAFAARMEDYGRVWKRAGSRQRKSQ